MVFIVFRFILGCGNKKTLTFTENNCFLFKNKIKLKG